MQQFQIYISIVTRCILQCFVELSKLVQYKFILKYTHAYIHLLQHLHFFPDLIAGVVASILVVGVLLSLAGGVVAVVLRARRKMTIEASQSQSKDEDKSHEEVDNTKLYQNVLNQPTPISGCSEPNYATAADVFVNPASATASFKAPVYSAKEIDQGPTDMCGGGFYEEARAEWSGEGCFKESLKGVSEKQMKHAVKVNVITKVKPEDLYAEPKKVKKKPAQKDKEVSKCEDAAAPSHDLYARPDMAKKKNQKGQQDVEQERKLPPQAPLPYTKHKETKHESEEDGEDVPELPPSHVPDEEQYYNTTGGGGPSSSEREYDYAVLDWQQK